MFILTHFVVHTPHITSGVVGDENGFHGGGWGGGSKKVTITVSAWSTPHGLPQKEMGGSFSFSFSFLSVATKCY